MHQHVLSQHSAMALFLLTQRSPLHGSACICQELVKYKAEKVCSKPLPDFVQQNQYEIWVTMKTLINQRKYTEIWVVLHFD